MIEIFTEWPVEKKVGRARLASEGGDFNTLVFLLHEGFIDTLNETEQRKLMAEALLNSATLHDRLTSNGIYHPMVFESQGMAEASATHSQTMRAKALDIRLNPEGKELKDQLEF